MDLEISLSCLLTGRIRHGNGVFLIVLVLPEYRLAIPCDAIGIDAVERDLCLPQRTLQRPGYPPDQFQQTYLDS